MGDAKTIERGEHAPGFGGHPCQCRRNLEVFQRREIVLQGIEMADEDEIPRILLALGTDRPPGPAQLPRVRRKQAAHDAQQARLAAAVGPGHAQQLAATEPEAEVAEQPPLASRALESSRFKHCCRALSRCPPAKSSLMQASVAVCIGADFALHQKSPTYRVIRRTPVAAKKTDFRLITCRAAARICWS